MIIDGQSWQTFTSADGLAGDTVLAVAVETIVAPRPVGCAGAWQSINPGLAPENMCVAEQKG